MGAFLVIIGSLLLALWVIVVPLSNESQVTDITASRPNAQAAAANLIQMHLAAVDFVRQTVNKNPASTTWSFTLSNQASVRCSPYASATYPTNSVSGTCVSPATEFRSPAIISTTSVLYNWAVYYKTGTPNIVVTYVQSASDRISGYTNAQIAVALQDFNLKENYPDWYWGVTQASAPYTLSNGSTTLTLPAGYNTASVVAIATPIN